LSKPFRGEEKYFCGKCREKDPSLQQFESDDLMNMLKKN
jgi:hypothetical protein